MSVVLISAGQNIQSLVDANPPNTEFRLAAGLWRLQGIKPKDGQIFRGTLGPGGARQTILSGAKQLTAFSKAIIGGRTYYFAGKQTQGQGSDLARCESLYRCDFAETLYRDDVPLCSATSLSGVRPGWFYFDYARQRIYFVDAYNNHRLEASVSWSAFSGGAAGVQVHDLIVQKYACPNQIAAIGGDAGSVGSGWIIQNCEVRFNHGAGVICADTFQILDNFIHNNGQIGIDGIGSDFLVKGNEVSFNNGKQLALGWSGVDDGFEAGGIKLSLTRRATISDNNVHDNGGPGIWMDGDCQDTVISRNSVQHNRTGIFNEISGRALIEENTIRGNGWKDDSWYWFGQIQISTSWESEILNNHIQIDLSNGGTGIVLLQQDRTDSDYEDGKGVHRTRDNSVHDNYITVINAHRVRGLCGCCQDDSGTGPDVTQANNTFDRNTYSFPDNSQAYWFWGPNDCNWDELRAAGQETNGSAG